MQITYQGREYGFDQRAITVDEWRELKRKYGMTPAGFEALIDEADPDATTFAYWVIRRQAGEQNITLGDHLKPDLLALNAALAEGAKAELARQAAVEPERPGPTGPLPGPVSSPPSPEIPGPAQN